MPDLPCGSLLMWPGNGVTLPAGYLECDGSAVSRTMYADLFTAIGTTYGEGDGSATFNLPDYSDGKFMEGSATAGTVKSAGLPNITGEITERNSVNDIIGKQVSSIYAGSFNGVNESTGMVYTGSSTSYRRYNKTIFDASRSSAIYGNSDTVQPYSCTVRVLIKAFNGQTADSALVDVTQYANVLNGKVSKHELYEENFTIIYPNNGTEANPANITVNSVYLETNPFPGYYVNCIIELYDSNNSKWYCPNVLEYYDNTGHCWGTTAYQLNDNIKITTGTAYISAGQATDAVASTAPCRVKVWKIGKIGE